MSNGEGLNSEKLKMNELGFTLNGFLKPKKGHLPIWLRAFKRAHPLDMSPNAICAIDDIENTILYVTIDGDNFGNVVNEIVKVKCVKIMLFFHPVLSDVRNLG